MEVKGDAILLKPVTLIVEERISGKQWQRFEDWATKIEKGDKVFNSAEKAAKFLRKKAFKK